MKKTDVQREIDSMTARLTASSVTDEGGYLGDKWDAIPQAFNDWWDADYDDTGNPYSKDSPAYWAWAGWSAAIKELKND